MPKRRSRRKKKSKSQSENSHTFTELPYFTCRCGKRAFSEDDIQIVAKRMSKVRGGQRIRIYICFIGNNHVSTESYGEFLRKRNLKAQ